MTHEVFLGLTNSKIENYIVFFLNNRNFTEFNENFQVTLQARTSAVRSPHEEIAFVLKPEDTVVPIFWIRDVITTADWLPWTLCKIKGAKNLITSNQ